MVGRDPRHGEGRTRRRRGVVWVPALVLALASAAVLGYDLDERWFGDTALPGSIDPAAVAPPPGLDLPELGEPPPVADPISLTPAAGLDPARVRRAIAPLLLEEDLGSHVLVSVSSLSGGAPAFRLGAGAAIPASTTKLLTAAAALATMGPDHTFETRVVTAGRRGIVIDGGGDPFLARAPARDDTTYPERADVATLAKETAKALRELGRLKVRVGYDEGLFTGPAVNPHWPDDYVPDGVVSPITALWVDEGRSATGYGREADPALTAATVFARALSRAGIQVIGAPTARIAQTDGVQQLASVSSAPLAEIVEQVLQVSDNEAAEVLARHVGLASSADGSFVGGMRGVARALKGLGVPLPGVEMYDGSGLSRENRISPAVLTAVLRVAAAGEHPDLRTLVTGLPVAGFTGSLASRFQDAPGPGRGRVRAKTGTLTGVSSLAGIATDLDGNLIVFALMADDVALKDTLGARDALDAVAAALGACHCGPG